MAKRIRCRCPVCGILVTQDRLNESHDFEFIVHEIGSRGRGRIYNIYRKADKVEGEAFFYFKAGLAQKLYQIADRLMGEVKEAAKGIQKHIPEEYIEEAIISTEFSSPTAYDEPATVELQVETTGYDEPVMTEFQSKVGGEEEWTCSENELNPPTVMED